MSAVLVREGFRRGERMRCGSRLGVARMFGGSGGSGIGCWRLLLGRYRSLEMSVEFVGVSEKSRYRPPAMRNRPVSETSSGLVKPPPVAGSLAFKSIETTSLKWVPLSSSARRASEISLVTSLKRRAPRMYFLRKDQSDLSFKIHGM